MVVMGKIGLSIIRRSLFQKMLLLLLTVILLCSAGSFILIPERNCSICTIDVSHPSVRVADICRGQQLEEFNHQFQGGLYAQLITNPSFEELENNTANWNVLKSTSSEGTIHACSSAETKMLNTFQKHCMRFRISSLASGEIGVANGGYWGIGLRNNTIYKLSFWARKGADFNGTLNVKLENSDGVVYAQSKVFQPSSDWQHFTCDLITSGIQKITGDNRFVIYASSTGDVYLDVITLMPPTWKDRPNGLRPDLGDKLAALRLKYVQFPGGCVAESAGMDISWNWKNSIGPLEERPGSTRNRWDYKNDLYFGLDDILQMCEDLGAEPVYTTSAGISEGPWDKKRFAICPLDKMKPIIDDILDLIEYCNGSASTAWGALRIKNGHPAPYNLKYLEIGNENGSENDDGVYSPRYAMIRKAVLERYPEIKIMFNGVCHTSKLSHTFGNEVEFTDEHFYNMNEFAKFKDLSVLYNRYDTIDPACKKICVAEYASSAIGPDGNVVGNYGDAIGDAIFNLGCEKNSERMWWTGFGNYASIIGQCVFGPCTVWNDAVSCFATPAYYVRKMLFSDNQGSFILPFTQNTVNCFWSASIDNEDGKNDILLKVANKSGNDETVNICLNGAVKIDHIGHVTKMKAMPEAMNSISHPENVVPSSDTFKAGKSFKYCVEAFSVSVLRIRMLNY